MQASVFIATSLDGYIARKDGAVDWLPDDGGELHGFTEFFDSVDAVVIGRNTYEWVVAYGGWPYGKKPIIVLSRTLTELNAPKEAICELMSGAPLEIVDRLAQRGMKHLYIDGGVTIQGFLEAGLIQRLTITRIPPV